MTETEESLHFLDYLRILRSRKEVVIAVAMLVIISGILVNFSLPKVYRATAVIQVKEEAPEAQLDVFPRSFQKYDPYFLRTQYEIIQSQPILEETIRQLSLTEKFGKAYGYLDELGAAGSFQQTLKVLQKSMKVQQYRDTNLIAIDIYLSEPKDSAPAEAAEIANRIAAIFRDQNLRRTKDATDRALKSLQDSLQDQEKKVADAQEKVETVREKWGLNIFSASFGNETTPLAKRTLMTLDDSMVRVRLDLEDKKSKRDKIMSLSPKDQLFALPHMVDSAALVSLVADKRKAEVEKSQLLSQASLGVNHPDVLRQDAIVGEIDKKIGEELQGLKTGVEADYDAALAKMTALEKMIGASKASDIESSASGYREFDKAWEEYQRAKKLRDALELRYHEGKVEYRIPRTVVEIIQPAKPADRNNPVSPRTVLNILLCIFAGITTGLGLAFFVEYLDTSVKTIEEVERFMKVPVLGVIPQKVRPFVEDFEQGAHVEAYRVLRTNIRFSRKQKDLRTLCVTSGSVGEGKSLTLFNLAYVCAQLGDRVLLVDSDLHRPRQHKILGLPNNIGLANVLVGEVDINDAIVQTTLPNMMFLPSGKLATGVHGLLDTEKMAELVDAFHDAYDITLFDAPPIIGVSDASLLVGKVDGVVLVVQHRKYPRSISNRAKEMVQNVGANLLGVVLNNINISRDYSYYYHYYSYPQPQQGKRA